MPRWIVALSVLVLVALRLPVITWGFGFDDYTHQLILDHPEAHSTLGPTSLFDWGYAPRPGDADFEEGFFPFWTGTDLRARFLRPFTSVSIAVDHALFGREPLGYHLTQLVFFALLLFALWRLYGALGLDDRARLLALWIFGLEEGSVAAVGWIANRSTLMVALAAVLSLGLLHSALSRTGGGTCWRAALALVFAALAIGAKESGLGLLLMLAFAGPRPLHAAWGRRPRLRRKLAIFAAVASVLYVALYVGLDYGTKSAFYPTPWSDPAGFLRFQALHWASFAGAGGPVLPDLALMIEGTEGAVVAIGALLFALLARPIARSVRELDAGPLLFVVAVATFLPQLMAAPSGRLLFVPMIGLAPLVGAAIRRGLASPRRVRRIGARALAFSTLGLAPLLLLSTQEAFGQGMHAAREIIAEAEIDPEHDRDLIVVQAPFSTMMLALRPLYQFEKSERPLRFWPLQFQRRGIRLERRAVDELVVESLDTAFLRYPFEYVYLGTRDAPAVGSVYRSGLFAARVEAVDQDGLRRFSLKLNPEDYASFDAPGLGLLRWDGERFAKLAVPAIGETIELERPAEPYPNAP